MIIIADKLGTQTPCQHRHRHDHHRQDHHRYDHHRWQVRYTDTLPTSESNLLRRGSLVLRGGQKIHLPISAFQEDISIFQEDISIFLIPTHFLSSGDRLAQITDENQLWFSWTLRLTLVSLNVSKYSLTFPAFHHFQWFICNERWRSASELPSKVSFHFFLYFTICQAY